MARPKFSGDQSVVAAIVYVELTLAQCQSILDKRKLLLERLAKEKPTFGEEVYEDYTVSKDLFINYRKRSGQGSVSTLDIWIKGEKYSISSFTMMSNLEEFMKY